MTYQEYLEVQNMSIDEFNAYLLLKHGSVPYSYEDKRGIVKGLERHHIREDKVANLSSPENQKAYPQYQSAEQLVYCTLLEHIFAHILIGEQNNGLGFGGAELMISKANDIYTNPETEEWEVLEELKERCGNSVNAYNTLFEHNMLLFAELDDALANNDRALVVLGTGLGKTTTALAYLRKYNYKALVLCPNNTVIGSWENLPEVEPITYAKFMNDYMKRDLTKYNILICDEAHHCGAARWGEGVRYVLDNQIMKVMGLTATPREGNKTEAKNYITSSEFFQNHICKGYSILDGIENEIIHDFSYVGAIYDTESIREKYKDISDQKLYGELDLALNNTPTIKDILLRHMPTNKRKGIIFTSNIEAIQEAIDIMKDIFPNQEYRAIHSYMDSAEIEANRSWFMNTDEGYLLAVNMISEGAHYPGVNTIIMFRRTQSSLVFNQQLGRMITLRKYDDPQGIVFDLVNNANNLDMEHSFSASLREAYQRRKLAGKSDKSEQIIIEDYCENISYILATQTRHNDNWDPEELNILYTFYPEEGSKVYLRLQNRTAAACKRKALKMGLHTLSYKRQVLCVTTGTIYQSQREAAELTGICVSSIGSCLLRKQEKAGNMHWCFLDEYNENWQPYYGSYQRNVAVYCLETDMIYESSREAERQTGINYGGILDCCKLQQATAGGYHWCYLSDKDTYVPIEVFDCRKKVYCYNTQTVYNSLSEASLDTGITVAEISGCCLKKNNSAKGTYWCFEDEKDTFIPPKSKAMVEVLCLELNKVFPSATAADNFVGKIGGVSACIGGHQKSCGGYHWIAYTEPLTDEQCKEKIKQIEGVRGSKQFAKKVRCIETGQIFDSVSDANKFCNSSHVSGCCNGSRKTAGGYHWEFVIN